MRVLFGILLLVSNRSSSSSPSTSPTATQVAPRSMSGAKPAASAKGPVRVRRCSTSIAECPLVGSTPTTSSAMPSPSRSASSICTGTLGSAGIQLADASVNRPEPSLR